MSNTKINLGNTLTTFKPEFINKVIDISKRIRDININDVDAKAELQAARAELTAAKAELNKVVKYINQDVPIITGKVIAIKKYEADAQSDTSIFDYMGENALKGLEATE